MRYVFIVVVTKRYQFYGMWWVLSGRWAPLYWRKFDSSEGGSMFVRCIDTYLPGYKMSHHTTWLLFTDSKHFTNVTNL